MRLEGCSRACSRVRAFECNVLCGSINEDAAYPDLSLPQALHQIDGRTVLIADRNNGRIRKFDLETRELSTFAGSGEQCLA